MAQSSTFPPVYPGLNSTPADWHHATPKLSSRDVRTIISVAGTTAIITHLCQHAIRHAAQHITDNGLTLADYERFVEYVRQRSAPTTSSATTVTHDDPRRDSGAGQRAAHATNKSARARKGVKG